MISKVLGLLLLSSAALSQSLLLRQPQVLGNEIDLNPQYQYGYSVNDPYFGDSKSHTESRDGDRVSGSYSVVLPDGTLQIVRYTAGAEGYNAVVEKQGGFAAPLPVVQKKVVAAAPQLIRRVPTLVRQPQRIVRPISQPILYSQAQPLAYPASTFGLRTVAPAPVVYSQAAPLAVRYPQLPAQFAFRPVTGAQVAAPLPQQQPQQVQQPQQAQQQEQPQEQPAADDSDAETTVIQGETSSASINDDSAVEVASSDQSVTRTEGQSAPASAVADGSSAFSYHSSGKQYNFMVAF